MSGPVPFSTGQLLTLHAKYPAERWWALIGDEGDIAGPCATPQDALKEAERLFNQTVNELLEDFYDITLGFLTEDAILLIHTDELVQAGLPAATALEMAGKLRTAFNAALEEQDPGEHFGMVNIFDVDENGELVRVLL